MVRPTTLLLCLAMSSSLIGGCEQDEVSSEEAPDRRGILVDSDAALDPPLATAAKEFATEPAATAVIDGQLDGDIEKFCAGEIDILGVIEGAPSMDQRCKRQTRAVSIPVAVRGTKPARQGRYLISEAAFRRAVVRTFSAELVDALMEGGSVEIAEGFDGLPAGSS